MGVAKETEHSRARMTINNPKRRVRVRVPIPSLLPPSILCSTFEDVVLVVVTWRVAITLCMLLTRQGGVPNQSGKRCTDFDRKEGAV